MSLTTDQHNERTKKQQRKKKEKQSRAAAADVAGTAAAAARTVAVVVGIANLSANAIGICNEYLNKRTNTQATGAKGVA